MPQPLWRRQALRSLYDDELLREPRHIRSNGILFDHASLLLYCEFVSRKVMDSAAEIALGKLDVLELGNVDAKRDWGYGEDYVDGIPLILQHDRPNTFVPANTRTETARSFVELASKHISIELTGRDQRTVRSVTTGRHLAAQAFVNVDKSAPSTP